MKKTTFLFIFFILFNSSTWAHDGVESFLQVHFREDGQFTADWEVPMHFFEDMWKDVDFKNTSVPLNFDEKKRMDILWRIQEGLAVLVDETPCELYVKSQTETLKDSKHFEKVHYEGVCHGDSLQAITLQWKFLAKEEKEYAMLISFESPGGTHSGMLTNRQEDIKFGLVSESSLKHFGRYVNGGILHIFEGIDHILFLITLILPAVFFLQSRKWIVRESFRPVFMDLLKTISAFTLAHSITLCLVTFGLLSISGKIIEPLIAFSVLVTSLNNLFPVVGDQRWKVAFVFGLVHGIGFAEVLIGMQLPLKALVYSLVGYNLGVEIGQLAIVSATLPVFFALRKTKFYKIGIFTTGSVLTAGIALLWMVDRIFDFKILPF